jgi:hypothetical protein
MHLGQRLENKLSLDIALNTRGAISTTLFVVLNSENQNTWANLSAHGPNPFEFGPPPFVGDPERAATLEKTIKDVRKYGPSWAQI